MRSPLITGRRTNLILIAGMVTVAAVIGLFPAILMIERPMLLVYFSRGGTGAGAAVWADRTAQFHSGARLHGASSGADREYFSIFDGGERGGLCCIGALRGLFLGVNWLAGKVGLGWDLNAELIAHYPSLVLAALGGVIYVVVAVQEYMDLALSG